MSSPNTLILAITAASILFMGVVSAHSFVASCNDWSETQNISFCQH